MDYGTRQTHIIESETRKNIDGSFMKLTFLGTGAAFTESPDNFQSNMFVEARDGAPDAARQGLLIDAGSDVRWSLKAQGLCHRNVSAVYISHLHADHVGGLEWLGFRTFFDPECPKPTLIATEGLTERLWETCLKGGMESLNFGCAKLDTYFDLECVPEGDSFSWRGGEFLPVRVPHFHSGEDEWSSFGLVMTAGDRTTFLTTDCSFDAFRLPPLYDQSDMVLHDCETSPCPSRAHSHYSELRQLPAEVKAKTWLYHYNDGDLPDALADGFLGFAVRGQSIDLG